MKIVHRMLIAPMCCVAMIFAVGIATGYALRNTSNALEHLFENQFTGVQQATAIETELLSVHADAYAMFTALEGLSEKKAAERLKALNDRLDAVRTKLPTPDASAQEDSLGMVEKLARHVAAYQKALNTAIDMASMDANMGRSGMQTADDKFKLVSATVASRVQLEVDAAREGYQSALTVRNTAYMVCGLLFVIAVVAAVTLSTYMARAIAKPVHRAIQVAKRIAGGDLTQSVAPGGDDEVGQLVGALSTMQDSLRQMISSASRSASELESASREMAQAADVVSGNVERQSDALSSAAAVVEEMTVSIAHVSDSASAVTDVAEQTSRTAEQGVSLVMKVTDEVRGIASTVDATAASMEALRESANQISGIANVIREIADQTNLLALNAAIEAARAGESGRGFAVVADEVRKLAEKTSNATQDIKQVIERIQTQSVSAANEMGAARSRVDAGAQLMEQLRDPLHAIEIGANEAMMRMRELSVAAREQSAASDSIAHNMENIASMGNDNAGSAQRCQTTATALQGLSRQLSDGIGKFRV
ncbi:MAG: methyl-accepting chemotaxis protein [Rhodocyclaceae bacterium]